MDLNQRDFLAAGAGAVSMAGEVNSGPEFKTSDAVAGHL